MTYSFTEKKRIRKSFAKRENVLEVPFLLATQLRSFADFLQAEVPIPQRKNEGLQAAFTSIFPIISHSGMRVWSLSVITWVNQLLMSSNVSNEG